MILTQQKKVVLHILYLYPNSKMLHCINDFATYMYHEKCTSKHHEGTKYTMSLSLHKVSLTNYIKIFFTAYNKLTTAHNDLMA